MALILTFLGKSGIARSKIAIAAAKLLANQGKRVLLAGLAEPTLPILLDTSLTPDPQEIAPNLQAVQFQSSVLLERNWEEAKKLEAQYLRTPIFKEVYGQELVVLPGMDNALALNAIREYDASGKYDAIIYDGTGDSSTLRMLGMPESMSWYVRRFRQLFVNSDLGKTITESPLIQPLITSFFNVNWTADNFAQPTNQVNNFLEQGKDAIADPHRVAAFLVTTPDPIDVANSRFLWGTAQQVGLTIGGAILVSAGENTDLSEEFTPLPVSIVPDVSNGEWQPLIDALPNFVAQALQTPKPIEIDVHNRQVRLFLPGFDKKQVKLTQYGPEVTVEAGDQRRNIFLPPALSGRPITGAKFQNNYLIISF
ncbi:ArsA family ATPase [Anabaena cylindrica FACHB-243]|uniref:Arsenite efflux ATP-binding protein ArsA n=1 Tax=Anabaena cylindrica (strain ATCC 27899 / PCC 7122) TaxID=272123 RepID=K9ZPJ1_ANACC|nr:MULTISPECIES: ArsA family ATPase [Anabaena]AFZ60240.1 arsenite efflux ATP-binding protein ArsA [Anabaena cylindrica PCC 7122]MBD2417707.1 ArsA family ATPase [Anabaena cylindrica FACHB-243]MBY5281284.1 ArsA family ATPase [Anabaena sp. CCAP 1446/1C]MBY5311560.1 ArsA family ATPase [Anabaena sp. CCAP 1446/1C]MCM2404622.1 ArsA family ATPase [Anabaena sp. CCAP 1446/1C]